MIDSYDPESEFDDMDDNVLRYDYVTDTNDNNDDSEIKIPNLPKRNKITQ